MVFYELPSSEEIKSIVKKYSKSGEKAKVSPNLKFENKLYREIVFVKKRALTKLEDKSFLYIDSDNGIVENGRLLKELSGLFYYASSFYDEEDKKSIRVALQSDLDSERNAKEQKLAEEAIDMLCDEGLRQAEIIKTIGRKVNILRSKTNDVLNQIVQTGNESFEELGYIDAELIQGLKSTYKELMSMNFEKVLVISKGFNVYDEVQKKAGKMKKRIGVRFNTDKVIPLSKLDYLITYYKKVIRMYESVINLNLRQYMKQHDRYELENITARVDGIKKVI